MKFTFGKHKGKDVKQVPREYIEWLIQTCENDLRQYKKEIERRDQEEEANMTMMDKIILSGFRALAKEAHPDKGGSNEQMRELIASHEALKSLMKTEKKWK